MPEIVSPDTITVEQMAHAIADRITQNCGNRGDRIHALHAISALADLAATTPEGVATALTRWRSELCGAADVLPHVEASLAAAEARAAAVLALHQPCHEQCLTPIPGYTPAKCQHCGHLYPCPTVRTLSVDDPTQEGTTTP